MTAGLASSRADVIVVGAGLSGLACARRLVAGGARVVVLEARDRVGGRLASGAVGGATVDLGGQWLSVGQPRLLALATELGAATVAQARGGRPHVGDTRGFFPELATAVAQWRAMRRIRKLVRAPPADADTESLATWLASTIRNATARDRLALHAELVLARDPADVSLLAYLARLGATGGFAPEGPDLPGGGREHRFVDGAHALAATLARDLAIALGDPVIAIDHARDGVVARTATRAHAAGHLVLALPPVLASAIAFAPAVPPGVAHALAASRVGGVVKCFAAYDAAYWRDAGWSGEAYLPNGDVRALVEVTTTVPVLLAFVVGAAAAGWRARDPRERRAVVEATIASRFGAREPLDYLEADWAADPWSAGCVASTAIGAFADARWREPFGRIHVAGTESAVAWPGYMEGALEAGERAADEVLAR